MTNESFPPYNALDDICNQPSNIRLSSCSIDSRPQRQLPASHSLCVAQEQHPLQLPPSCLFALLLRFDALRLVGCLLGRLLRLRLGVRFDRQKTVLPSSAPLCITRAEPPQSLSFSLLLLHEDTNTVAPSATEPTHTIDAATLLQSAPRLQSWAAPFLAASQAVGATSAPLLLAFRSTVRRASS